MNSCSKLGFPGSSAGKESACNVGDLGLIPGEGKGYPLQYSLAWRILWTVKSVGSQRVGKDGHSTNNFVYITIS